MDKKVSAEKKLTEEKTFSFGKLAGIIFCVLAAVCTVILLFISGYFSGQMKTIDKLYTAVQRDDIVSYKACFPRAYAENISEADLEAEKAIAAVLDDPEDFKTDVSFSGREKLGDGRYAVTFDLMVYTDSESEKIGDVTKILVRDGTKWVFEVIN